MKRAVIYTRVSRDDTGEGKSNQRQQDDCEKLAALRGWEIVEVCEDISISAYGRKRRPGWERVLELMQSGAADVVVAWAVDRMTRSMTELENLIVLAEDNDVAIATVTGDLDLTTDVGRMVARILGAVARQEVERKSARQRRANQQRAAEGKPRQGGWRAFGFADDGVTHVPDEAELIRDAAERMLAGTTSIAQLAREWEEKAPDPAGLRGGKGKWSRTGVRAVLLNPKQAGLMRYAGDVVGRGDWEPIIEEATWVQLVAVLNDPARRLRVSTSKGRTPENLLTGIAQCVRCGSTVTAGSADGKPTYRCPNDHVRTPRYEVDALVRTAFATHAATGRADLLGPVDSGDRDALTAEAEAVTERLTQLAMTFARGGITAEQLEAGSTPLRAQLEDVEARLASSSSRPVTPFQARAQSVAKFLELSMNEQRAVLSDLAVITLHPRGKGRHHVPVQRQVSMKVRHGDRMVTALDVLS